jgi:hypothetical protein
MSKTTELEAARAERTQHEKAAQGRLRDQALAQALAENDNLRQQLEAFSSVGLPTVKHLGKPSKKSTGKRGVACVVASDWHVDEVVETKVVNGLNSYNPDIAQKRSEEFFRNALKLTNIAAKESEIDTIYLAVLGDLFSGWIHEEGQELNSMSPVQAAMFAGDLLASGIAYWLRNSKYKIVGDALPGNHGRLTKKIRSANVVATSLETVTYARVMERFASEPRVNISLADGGIVYRRFFDNFTMRLLHGYEIKYAGGIGGLSVPLRRMIAGWDKGIRANLTVFGHYHQYLPGTDAIGNGSLIGFNAFAQRIAASPEIPQQAFLVIHERDGGRVALQAPIWVQP